MHTVMHRLSGNLNGCAYSRTDEFNTFLTTGVTSFRISVASVITMVIGPFRWQRWWPKYRLLMTISEISRPPSIGFRSEYPTRKVFGVRFYSGPGPIAYPVRCASTLPASYCVDQETPHGWSRPAPYSGHSSGCPEQARRRN